MKWHFLPILLHQQNPSFTKQLQWWDNVYFCLSRPPFQWKYRRDLNKINPLLVVKYYIMLWSTDCTAESITICGQNYPWKSHSCCSSACSSLPFYITVYLLYYEIYLSAWWSEFKDYLKEMRLDCHFACSSLWGSWNAKIYGFWLCLSLTYIYIKLAD